MARKLDLENPDVLVFVRIGYLTAQIIILAACYFAAIRIKGKNGKFPYYNNFHVLNLNFLTYILYHD